jgi:hypothetical protein
VTVSEFAFLAIGLMLGVAGGVAVIVISTARSSAVNEIRLTVTPNAIPQRRRSTLSEDAFADHSAPARGGPAERLQDERDDLYRWKPEPPQTRTIVRSAPLPPAGAGDPESSAQGPLRISSANPWPAAAGNRAPLPASIVASYPRSAETRPAAMKPAEMRPMVAIPIRMEADLAMAALRESAARTAERLMRQQHEATTGTLERGQGGFEPLSALALAASNGGHRRSTAAVAAAGGTSAGGTTAAPLREGNGSTAPGGACDETERIADERCSVAARAREQAGAADEAVREAQRAYDERGAHVERAAIAADPGGMRVAKETAQHAFRRARAGATTRQAIEAAAQMWLTEINRINQGARDAAVQVERERQASAGLVATVERLTVEADAARAAADAAATTCEAARAAVAECHERVPGTTPARPLPPITPFPVAAMGQPPVLSPNDNAALAGFAANGANESAIIRLLQGDRATLGRLVDQLAGTDAAERRRWQLVLAALIDAIVATSIESSILSFPHDHPFWGDFSQSQSRDVAAALASLGFRFDGLGGWADDRIPSQRDLSLATGYAGLDPMRIRRWPSEAETAELYRDVSVAADEYLGGAARGLTLGELVGALGRRADALTDVWNDWDRLRPLLLGDL